MLSNSNKLYCHLLSVRSIISVYFLFLIQKNEVITPLEPSIFTRDIQNNIRVRDSEHLPKGLRLTKSYDSLLQTMALCQKEIFDLMRSNAQLVESIQNQSLGKDDSNSIDHSRL